MRVVSSASCAVSIQQSIQPTSRTTSASLCSTPNAPGSSRARLPTRHTMGTRSGGVTTRHSIAYIQPTPDEPQNTRAPTVEACFTISNWLCSPSATMYSATSWPPEIFLAIACMTVSYGRIGYAVTTSRSARARASATASLPEIRSSLSSSLLAARAAGVTTAIALFLRVFGLCCAALDLLVFGVLARDARSDLGAAILEALLELLLVLTAEPEPVRADGRLLVADLLAQPGLILLLVLAPHLPLTRVVLEHRLVHHRDAVLDRAHSLADATAAARLHVGVVGVVGHHVEAGVRALDPAERALHARVEVDDRPHRARRELLEVGVPLGHVALAGLLGLADGDRRDRHALAHLPPLRHLERVRDFRVALGHLDVAALQALVGFLRRIDLEIGSPLDLADGVAHALERQERRGDLGEGAEDPRLGVVLLVDPQSRERRLRADERQLVGRVLLVDVLQEALVALQRRHQHRTVGLGELVDRLQPIPRPRLHALRERVVDDHRDVHVLGLVARHVLLELFLRVGDDREVFRGDAVALRAVAVAAERDAPPARLAGGQHDAAGDASGEVLLKDAAINDFTDQSCHSFLLELAGLRRGSHRGRLV